MQATPPPDQLPAPRPHTPDLHARFERLARCIRQTMLLENQIADARRTIVTRTIQLEKDRAYAAEVNASYARDSDREYAPRLERVEHLQRERFPTPASPEEFPCLLHTVGQEMGIDFSDITNPKSRKSITPHSVTDPPPD